MKRMYGFGKGEEIEYLAWAYNYWTELKILLKKMDQLRYESQEVSALVVDLRNEINYFRRVLFQDIKGAKYRNLRSKLITTKMIPPAYRLQMIKILMNE
jgi:hypothetical protein